MRHLATIHFELEQLLRGRTALAIFVVALALFGLAFGQGGARTRQAQDMLASAEAKNWAGWLAQGPQNPHGAAHYPMLLAKPPAPLGGLAEGVESALGAHVFTDAHRVVPVNGAPAAALPLARVVGSLDAAFVIGVALPLLAVLSGAEAIAGEKERGTLRLVFANPVGRRRWLAAKLAARVLALWLLTGAAAWLAWLMTGGVMLGDGWGWRLPLFAAIAALYLLVWVLAGALCSAWNDRVAGATLAATVLWIACVVVLPRALTTASSAGTPPPASAPARMATRVEEVRLRRQQEALVEAARARGELAGASATAIREGNAPIREKIDSEAALARARAELPLVSWRERQLRRLETLAYLSPTLLYFQLASATAGTDYARHVDYLGQAAAYRHDFLAQLNGLEDRGQPEYNDYARMRRFGFTEATAGELARRELGRLLALLLFAAGLLVATLSQFRRYDLR
jgi:ABC-2 type transport system permease protein